MFSDLKKGFQVHTLDTNTVPKYELGKVVAVSEPRYLPPQPGQYQAMQTRVVDLTVELTGETKTYTVPESQNVAKAMGITLSTYVFRSSFVSEDQTRKTMVKAGNNATKILVKTFRGKLFKKAFERARRGKDISSFERQEKESGFNFLYNPNNGRMQSGHIIIDGIGLFKQIIHER